MEFYSTGAGAWNSVFAVPSDVVDKYIKLAGAAQLKVLLWLLRNNCKRDKITANDIATALNMNPIDVKDCMEFWLNVGLFNTNTDNSSDVATVSSVPPISDKVLSTTTVYESLKSDDSQNMYNASESSHNLYTSNITTEIKNNMDNYTPPSRTIARVQKPDSVEVAQRIAQDDGFAILVDETEKILGRPLTNNDTSTLLLLHDSDGLPYEVITMILYFAKAENKMKMKYIEALGREWGDSGIDTIEKAEEKINDIMMAKESWSIACSAFGLKNNTTPTKKQTEYADIWINKWGYDEAMLHTAYETCMNNRGEFNLSYINGIIRKWHSEGILTEKDLADSKRNRENNKEFNRQSNENTTSIKVEKSNNTSYDINVFKDFDIFE
ncbi:MAG: DnaD domain protein [Acutalibacteraceae bacterium]|nr:DnaD domain protein [Acutalibacteraceae bacterium]